MALKKDPFAFRGRDRRCVRSLLTHLQRVVEMDQRNSDLRDKGHDKALFLEMFGAPNNVGDLMAACAAALSAHSSDIPIQTVEVPDEDPG